MAEPKPGTRIVKVTFTARWEDYVEVIAPDGITEAEAEKALNAAIDLMDMTANLEDHDIDTEAVEWEDPPVYAPPDPTVPDAAWMEIDGARWATNGHIMIREGCPLPDTSRKEEGLYFNDWMIPCAPEEASSFSVTYQRASDGLREWLSGDSGKPSHSRFNAMFAPILKAGTATGDGVTVVRDATGLPLAVLRPIRDDGLAVGVDARGNP